MVRIVNNLSPLPDRLLDWYDRHARTLPWRVGPAERAGGVAPDPYRVWLSEIMLQQTTVAAVKSYFETFTTRWPRVGDLAAAEDAQVLAAWAGLGYYARARNLLKCARIIAQEHAGSFPQNRAGLQALPGIGPYTSAAIAAIAFDQPETVVDGNVERVIARLHAVETPLPKAKKELTARASELTPATRPGDYAQAVMDLGATICTSRNPVCGLCPWRDSCAARAAGTVETYPRKMPKPVKPTRRGIAYFAERSDGALLLERRPENGLLGGMLGFPGTAWQEAAPDPAPPLEARWHDCGVEIRHTFTHFHLRLRVLRAEIDAQAEPDRGRFVARAEFRPSDLPKLMRKIFDAARV